MRAPLSFVELAELLTVIDRAIERRYWDDVTAYQQAELELAKSHVYAARLSLVRCEAFEQAGRRDRGDVHTRPGLPRG